MRKSFKTDPAYADMILKRNGEYLNQWNQRLKRSKKDVRKLKEEELVLMADDAMERCENKVERVIQVFNGDHGVVQSAEFKMMAHFELNRPVVKMATVFYNDVLEMKNRNSDFGETQSERKKQLLKLKKIRNCQKSVKTENFFKLGPRNCTTPQFWEGKT